MILTGRVAVPLLAVLPIVAVVEPTVTALALANLVVAVLVALDVVLAASLRDVEVTRSGPRRVRLGQSVDVTLTLTNHGRRRLAGWIRDAWQPSAQPHLMRMGEDVDPGAADSAGDDRSVAGPTAAAEPVVRDRRRLRLRAGERLHLVTRVTPLRRGDRHADHVAIRAVGPLGIAGRQRVVPLPWSVRTLPPFTSRRLLPSRLSRLREIDGRTVLNTRGEGTEFDSLRHYVPGDDVRSIDWRATARSTDVMVRTWRPERDRTIVVVLDTGRTAAARVGQETRLDVSIDAALLISALGSRAGDRVDLLAYDRAVRAEVRGVRSADLLHRVVEATAPLDPTLVETDAPGLVSTLLARGRKRALVILFTGLDAPVIEEGLLPVLPALTRRNTVMIAAASDAELLDLAEGRGDITEVYHAAAAQAALSERARVATRLNRLGCVVVDRPPDLLAAGVADTYLDLKAAGRL